MVRVSVFVSERLQVLLPSGPVHGMGQHVSTLHHVAEPRDGYLQHIVELGLVEPYVGEELEEDAEDNREPPHVSGIQDLGVQHGEQHGWEQFDGDVGEPRSADLSSSLHKDGEVGGRDGGRFIILSVGDCKVVLVLLGC